MWGRAVVWRERGEECGANLSLRKEKEGEGRRRGRREGGRKEERVTWRDERPYWLYVAKHPECISLCL